MTTTMDSASNGGFPPSEGLLEEHPALSENLPQDESNRVVMVVTVPVKDKGFMSKKFMTLLTWLFGSQLTWAMHWALLVDKTAFELQRPRGRGKPYLKASIWPEEKVKEIVSSYPVGSTTMNDEEILKASMNLFPFLVKHWGWLDSYLLLQIWSANKRLLSLGTEYFSRETQPYYDLTVNNCQIFVLFATNKISPMIPLEQLPIGIGGQIAAILLTIPSRIFLPFIVLYLRWWLGLDSENLDLFCVLFSYFMSCCVSCLFTLHSQVSYMIAENFLSMPQGMGAFIAFPIVLMSSFTMPAMFFLWPWLCWPHVQRSGDGRWVVFSRLHPLKTQEEQNGDHQPAEEPLKSIPVWILIAGAMIGAVVWSSIAIPFVLRWLYDILRNHISFTSPGSFLRSIQNLLATPFVIIEGEARNTVEALHPQALEAAEMKLAAKAKENET